MQSDDIGATIAAQVRWRMGKAGLNPKSLSKEASLNETYVRDILVGKSKNPRSRELGQLAKALKCSADDLKTPLPEEHMGNTADLPTPPPDTDDDYVEIAYLYLRPGMGGGGYEDLNDAVMVRFPRRLIRDQLGARPEDIRVVEVEGPSMEPMLESGDQVLVNIAKRNPSQPGIFCLWDGFGIVCKLVERIRNTDPPKVRIISANPVFQPEELTEEEAHIIGRVVWFARKL